jgi:hypothetical protein
VAIVTACVVEAAELIRTATARNVGAETCEGESAPEARRVKMAGTRALTAPPPEAELPPPDPGPRPAPPLPLPLPLAAVLLLCEVRTVAGAEVVCVVFEVAVVDDDAVDGAAVVLTAAGVLAATWELPPHPLSSGMASMSGARRAVAGTGSEDICR